MKMPLNQAASYSELYFLDGPAWMRAGGASYQKRAAGHTTPFG